MALQDDIMALLSQISDAGDRATSREALGRKLYDEMGDRLSGDTLYNALRDVESARGPMGEMEDYSRIADILEKYMQDAAEPLPDTAAAMPRPRPDVIVDNTEQMMEGIPSLEAAPRTPVSSEELPNPAPRTPVLSQELPPLPQPDLDEDAVASMAREFGGERQMNQARLRAMGLSSLEGGAIPLRDRLMEEQGEPMSGTNQLMLASLFIPAAWLPQAAARIGMGAAQIANFLRAGKRGEQALRQVIRQRTRAQTMRDPATGQWIGKNSVGPFKPPVSTPKPLHQQFGSTGQARQTLARRGTEYDPKMYGPGDPSAMSSGGSIQQSILNRYNRMY